MKQRFFWVAILNDKTIITEFNSDGSENSYSKLPREKIEWFGITSANNSYFFNLKTGKLHLDNIDSDGIDIKIPLRRAKMPVSLTGQLNGYYNFFQYKEAHQDFNLGLQTRGNVIDKHVFGWKQWKYLNVLGKVFVEIGLVIQPAENNGKPTLKVILRSREDGNPIAGSPYEMKF
jgi:hypothetical protein